MAYKALYRSYRPQVFAEVAGQTHIIKTLENAIKTNKIAHAYLFSGPRGTGKTSIAKIFAKAINCRAENAPCGNCDICNSVMTGEHPDVIEIDAASNNGVDEVRDLIDKVKYAPINGKYKIYIIDEVHMMTTGAFNALLKTLEEPPAHAVFILATTEPHKILPTIISRCQRFDFKKVEEPDIIKYLEYVLNKEGIAVDQKALSLIARLAEGGMRDALSILEQCIAFNSTVTEETVNNIYGLLSVDKKVDFIKKLLAKDMQSVLISVENMLSSSIDIKRLTFDIIDILKDVIIYKNTNNTDILLSLTKDTVNTIVPYIVIEEAFTMIDILIEASNKYKQSLNAKMYFELAILKIANQVVDTKEPVPQNTQTKIEIMDSTVHMMDSKEEKVEIVLDKEAEIDTVLKEVEQIVNEPIQQNDIYTPPMEELEEPVDTTPMKEEVIAVKEELEPKQTMGISKQDIEVDFADIINILVQADRKVLKDVQEKWEVISRYRFNLNTAKLASLLCEGKPVAAGPKAIIIAFVHKPMVNEVNYSNNYYHLKQFLKEVLGQEYDFIAIRESEWGEMRQKYISLLRQQQLPKPSPIVLHHIQYVEEEPITKLNEAQQFALDMFGGEIVEFEES